MKHYINKRLVALILTLALLVPMTALSEEELLPDGSVDSEDIVIEGDAADLSLEEENIVLPEGLDEPLELSIDDILEQDTTEPADESESNVAAAAVITLGVKEKYTLDGKAIGSGKKVTYKTSKKKVATVSSKGVIRGVKKGSAEITCYVNNTQVAAFDVVVVSAPKKVSVDISSATIGVKETLTVTPTIPDGTHASFTWSSKDKKIATVSSSGKIKGKKAGKTTITVKTQNGKKATVKVTVKKAPDSVKLNKATLTLSVGDSTKLTATLPSKTASRSITWSSSDEGVARVDGSGVITAVNNGTANITARTFNGKTATCTVTVKDNSGGEVVYRALLIGEESFYSMDTCTRNRGDVGLMANMLNSVRGLYGGTFSITRKYDLSKSGTLTAIKSTFASADDNDVSLFFIATHGDVDATGDYAGYLYMSPEGILLLKDLASALKAVPGKVIVILESCGSGAAVYANNGDGKNALEAGKQKAIAFDAAVARVFSNVDPRMEVEVQPKQMNSSGVRSNTGEFRVENKFYVLCCSNYHELSWGKESGPWNFFTKWLTEGIGTSGTMPADVNRNGQTTLNELYNYIAEVGDDYPFDDYENGRWVTYYQHVQVYPKNSSFVLFKR